MVKNAFVFPCTCFSILTLLCCELFKPPLRSCLNLADRAKSHLFSPAAKSKQLLKKYKPSAMERVPTSRCSFSKTLLICWQVLWLHLCLCCFCSTKVFAQPPYLLHIQVLDQDSLFLKKHLQYQVAFSDTSLLRKELEQVLNQLRQQAYLEASFDSTALSGAVYKAWLHIGKPYEWAWLENGNVEETFLSRSGFKGQLYRGKVVDLASLTSIRERLLEQAENSGFPFAQVWIDSFQFAAHNPEPATGRRHAATKGNLLSARIYMDKGPPVFFDSLNVEGNVKISKAYLHKYLGIRQGDPYSRHKVLKIRSRMRDLAFLKEKKSMEVIFREDKADLQLYLEKKRASRFDFLLGLLPDNRRSGQKVILTGTFNAEFQNQLGWGERLYLSFDRLRPQTQRLEAAFTYPYLLDLPFGIDLNFNQYRRDSTYTDIIGELGVQYLFEGGNYLKVFWRNTTSNLISADTAAISRGHFPRQLDVKSNAFGIEVGWQSLDYRFNPRKGWNILLNSSTGLRQIRPNRAILSVAESFYDTLQGLSFRFLTNGKVERYLPLMQRSTLRIAAQTAAIISQAPVYQNEQYRIGGNRLMRGFDEESIFATFFSVFTLEYRLLTGQNSWLYLFGDYGYVEDRSVTHSTRYTRPLSFGTGMTIETAAGVFGISLALGKQGNVPFDFRNPKVHFGYVSIF